MTELLRTNDLVLLSWLQALLSDAGIQTVLLDSHTALAEGSLGVLPRRLMVDDDDAVRARRIAREAEISLPDPHSR
ncbi:MAG: DUF2007 domain-containing protein [Proteobacteria bacterium]|nr:DUF2007 domain-containing protein [Pseudomonadota bacterium]MDA1131767.1 DUF2007 domain-containing protein [Pseudomonadota bacterium]